MSLPKFFLRFEGFIIFIFSVGMYFYIQGNLILFIILVFAPDIFMLGYLLNKQYGALIYNAFHIYFWPVLLFLISIVVSKIIFAQIGFVWLAHISLDRALGYGLKYKKDFQYTHFRRL